MRKTASGQPGRRAPSPRPSTAISSKAPEPAAAATGVGRNVALEVCPELPVAFAVPDLGEALAESIAEHEPWVVTGHPGRNAAGEHITVGGHVGERPRSLTSR